mmetsp:Transcript_10289/g.14540  ORF Transcript_10289/g.14540 Transcript_10289/m.14540 type:complete len:630 (+) Transcript_10289:227-2116(+)
MLISQQTLMTVCLSLCCIVTATTALNSANDYLSSNDNSIERENLRQLKSSKSSTSGGKKGKKYYDDDTEEGKNNLPPSTRSSGKKGKKYYYETDNTCGEFDIDSLLLIDLNGDLNTFSNDATQSDAFEKLVISEYNELAAESCGDGVLVLESADSSLGEAAIPTNRRARRRLGSDRQDPDWARIVNTKGKCGTCRNNNALEQDAQNTRKLSFEEAVIQPSSSVMNRGAGASSDHHQRQEERHHRQLTSRQERSGQVADKTMLGKSGKKSGKGAEEENTMMGKKVSGDGKNGKNGSMEEEESKGSGKKGSNVSNGQMNSGKKGTSPSTGDSIKGKKGSSPATGGSMDGENTSSGSSSSSYSSAPVPSGKSGKSGKGGKGKTAPVPQECCIQPSEADLSNALDEAVQSENGLSSISAVNDVTELSEVDCDDEITTLHGVVTIEHTASRLKSNELHLLAETFIEAYNQVNSLSKDVCDMSFRTVTECYIEEPDIPEGKTGKSGKSGNDGRRYLSTGKTGKAPTSDIVYLNYYYKATCRGCQEGSKIFEPSSSGRSLEHYGASNGRRNRLFAGDHRLLSDIVQARCFCPPVPPAESRGPFTSEFVDIFTELFEFLRVEGDINYITSVGAVMEH